MGNWYEKYIGEPYIEETNDCMRLVERIANEVLGLKPNLPKEHPTSLREQAIQFASLKDVYAVKIDKPLDAHPILFIARGRFYHAGAVVLINEEVYVLHNDQTAGMTILQRLRDLTRWVYEFQGFYQWKT